MKILKIILKNQKFSNKKGSFALEAAIVFPVIIVILMFYIWQITVIRSETVYKSFLLSEAEKAPAFGVLYQISNKYLIESYLDEIDDDTSEFIFALVYKKIFKMQLEKNYKDYLNNNPSHKSVIKSHRFFIENNICDNVVEMTSVYDIYTPFGTVRKMFVFPVAFWTNNNVFKSEISKAENVWDKSNFDRGKILRSVFGGNLPFGYPVLSGFKNNTAFIIRSMDLNANSWQNPDTVHNKLLTDIIKLYDFKGNSTPWGKDGIIIPPEDIHYRYIIFVFPENIDYEKYKSAFEKIIIDGKSYGINIDIKHYQSSTPNDERIID